MVGGERTRAYRYGITLVCVGALFNWLGYTEQNSDPVRFIGYTCLASGALLLCMAICFWANSSPRSRANQQAIPDQGLDFSVVTVVDPASDGQRFRREKPPDYSTVADMTPPPCYDEAIKLSPVFLQPQQASLSMSDAAIENHRCPESCVSSSSQLPPLPPAQPQAESEAVIPKSVASNDNSTLSKVIRLSSRLLRRTLSNVDCGDQQTAATSRGPEISRSQSAQNVKDV